MLPRAGPTDEALTMAPGAQPLSRRRCPSLWDSGLPTGPGHAKRGAAWERTCALAGGARPTGIGIQGMAAGSGVAAKTAWKEGGGMTDAATETGAGSATGTAAEIGAETGAGNATGAAAAAGTGTEAGTEAGMRGMCLGTELQRRHLETNRAISMAEDFASLEASFVLIIHGGAIKCSHTRQTLPI
jgi:hypothetical protein